MLRPEPMSRVLVVGPKDQLEPVIETLHRLRLVHLVDHRGEDEAITMGRPLPKASEISDQLEKPRSIASILKVGGAATGEQAPPIGDLRQQIMTIEMNLREDDEARKRIESLVQDLDRRIEEL